MVFFGIYNDWCREQRFNQAYRQVMNQKDKPGEYLDWRNQLNKKLGRPLRRSEKIYVSYQITRASNSSKVKSMNG